MQQHVLLLEVGDKPFMESVQNKFRDIYECHRAKTIDEALHLISQNAHFFAVVANYQGDGTIEFLEKCREIMPTTSRIMVADKADMEVAVVAINRARVFKFLQKPVDMDNLGGGLSSAAVEYEHFQQIQRDSFTDPLTGLYNRRFMEREMNRIFELARRYENQFSLIFGDVNRFKLINDNYGHHLGDVVLKSIGAILIDTCRGSDMICRYGGDEFLILIELTTHANAERLIARINDSMQALEMPELAEEHFSLSLGQGTYPDDGSSVDAILNVADTRMYEAKKQRKSR